MSIENDLKSIRRIFVDYPNAYKQKQEELKLKSSEKQDLLHALELGNLNGPEQMKITRDLKKVQIERRKIKNNLEVLDEIKRFRHGEINEKKINNLINKIDHVVNKKRYYHMRVRKDLQDLVEVK